MPLPIIPIVIIAAGGGLGIGGYIWFNRRRRKMEEELKNKKVMMLGPRQSGKTTFYTWLKEGKPCVKYEVSNFEIKSSHYKDLENNIEYIISDMVGAEESLAAGVGERLYKDNDIILFFFDAAKYFPDYSNTKMLTAESYISNVNVRFEALSQWYKEEEKPILMIGTHRDDMTRSQIQNGESLVSVMDKTKDYYQFVCRHKFVLVNLMKKEDVSTVLKHIIELLKN